MSKVERRALLVVLLILLAGCFVGLSYNGYQGPPSEETPTPEPTPSTPVATEEPTSVPTATPTPDGSGEQTGSETPTEVGTDFGDEGWDFDEHYEEYGGVGDANDRPPVRIGGEGNVTGEQETVTSTPQPT